MNVPDWFRKIPHPQYGHYCGIKRVGPGMPKDEVDEWCRIHDLMYRSIEMAHNLKEISDKTYYEAKNQADKILGHGFRFAKKKSFLSKTYAKLAGLIFRE